MDTQQYIHSGVLEAYLLGLASDDEQREVLEMKVLFPEVSSALNELEVVIESYCLENAVPPPPGTWDLIEAQTTAKEIKKRGTEDYRNYRQKEPAQKTDKPDYLEVEFNNTHIQVHKYWRTAFIAVFILSKIFLITGLYYYFKADTQSQEIERLKTVIQQQSTR